MAHRDGHFLACESDRSHLEIMVRIDAIEGVEPSAFASGALIVMSNDVPTAVKDSVPDILAAVNEYLDGRHGRVKTLKDVSDDLERSLEADRIFTATLTYHTSEENA